MQDGEPFPRRDRRRGIIRIVAVVLLAIGALAAWSWLAGEVAIDRCLDAGGRWNAATRGCEGGGRATGPAPAGPLALAASLC